MRKLILMLFLLASCATPPRWKGYQDNAYICDQDDINSPTCFSTPMNRNNSELHHNPDHELDAIEVPKTF